MDISWSSLLVIYIHHYIISALLALFVKYKSHQTLNIQYKIHLFFTESTSPDVQKKVQVYYFFFMLSGNLTAL